MKPSAIHLLITVFFYMYYTYLWLDKYLYTGKPGWNGYNLFIMTAITAPAFIFYHLLSIGYSIRNKEKSILIINVVGLVLCLLHVAAVLS